MIEPGHIIGREFLIEQPLGSGGMGAVFVALQKSTGVRRALKLMHPEVVREPRLRERFAQEARVSGSIPSDHVVQVITAGIDEDTSVPFLVMELLEGEDLSTSVRRGGPFDAKTLGAVFEQLCHAVGAAHRAGIVHRDLKPENIFLSRSRIVGAPFLVKVLDFGIAKIVAEARARMTEPMGTPHWMAPEQTARDSSVSPQTDVWALGLIAFFCLTGHTYWASGDDAHPSVERILREMLVDDLVRPSKRAGDLGLLLPRWFDAWFARCVDRDPTARFPDATKAGDALARCIRGRPGAAPTEPMPFSPVADSGVPATLPLDGEGNGARSQPMAAAGRAVASSDNGQSVARAGGTTSLNAASDRDRRAANPVIWFLVAAALVAGVFALRSTLAASRSSSAPLSNGPSANPTVVTSAPETDSVESLVKAWNAAHASKNDRALARLYAESVLYYGSQQSKEACLANKRAFLDKNPDFRQWIMGDIRVEQQRDEARATFLKHVLFHGQTTDYPSYLVFRRSTSGWQIVTEGDAVTDANLAKRDAKATAAPKIAVVGDFDGDGKSDSVWLVPPKLPDKQTEDNYGNCIGKCDCRLVFADSKLPPITVEGCIGGTPVNEGDLDGDGADEIGLLPGWWHGCWRDYKVYTFKNAAWKFLVDPISTHCNQWDNGVDVIEQDSKHPGYVTIRYSDSSASGFAVKSRSVRVR